MEALRKKKYIALLAVAITYAFAFASAYAVTNMFDNSLNPLLTVLIADLVATGVVFICSVIVDNSSMYDPYWSVAVPIMLYYWITNSPSRWTIFNSILFGAICLWSIRLTLNCLVHWQHLDDEDWRYVSFRKKFGICYWPVSLFAIHLFPTLIVFACCIPAYSLIQSGEVTNIVWYVAGIALIIAGFVLQLIADIQMDRFIQNRTNHDEVCSEGLWQYSRHPNYLGEISIWYGVTLCSWGFGGPFWAFIVFPLAMTILFLSYSIPAMERHILARRPQYKLVQQTVSILIPRSPRTVSADQQTQKTQ